MASNLDKRLRTLAFSTPTFSVHNVANISPIAFRVNGEFGAVARNISEDEVSEMFRKSLGDQFQVIPASFSEVETRNGRTKATAIVQANTMSKPYSDDVAKSMQVISANVFMDKFDKSIWKVVGEGNDKRLVQSQQENFSALLSSRLKATRSQIVACSNTDYNMPFESADFGLYYSTARERLESGFILKHKAGITAFSMEKEMYEDIKPEAVVRTIARETLPDSVFTEENFSDTFNLTDNEFTPTMKQNYATYMQFLYSGTAYFKKLQELLTLRQQHGRDNQSEFTIR